MEVVDLTFTKSLDALGRAVERRRSQIMTDERSKDSLIRPGDIAIDPTLPPGTIELDRRIYDIATGELRRRSYFAKRPDETGRPRPRKKSPSSRSQP